ncbi:MAG: hypothetical protein K2Q14_00020 [Gammaproteobacteria bacterium]|nr:hypothetical protein [Gammaproteobacteria bacterium]
MSYTKEQIKSYYNRLKSDAKMDDAEIIVVRMDELRSLVQNWGIVNDEQIAEPYKFKNKPHSGASLYIIQNEFNRLMAKLNAHIENNEETDVILAQNRLNTLVLSKDIFKYAVESLINTRRETTKFDNIKFTPKTFTCDFLANAKNKAEKISLPVAATSVSHTQNQSQIEVLENSNKEGLIVVNNTSLETKFNNDSKCSNNNNEQQSKQRAMYIAKLFPVYDPTQGGNNSNNQIPIQSKCRRTNNSLSVDTKKPESFYTLSQMLKKKQYYSIL